jgi:polysaccharide lyase-like protein
MQTARLLTVGLSIAIASLGVVGNALPQASNVTSSVVPLAGKICSPASPGPHEKYRLPATKALSQGISFATDWTHSENGGWFGVQVVDRCRMRPDNGFLTWHGMAAVRVEVQPNDDPLALNANSERAEVLFMQDVKGNPLKETAQSGTQYYATSYYFPENWQGQQLPWSAFPATDCTARGQNQCNSWSFVWQFLGWGAMSAAQMSVRGPQEYRFNGARFVDGGRIALGKWSDFVFSVEWSTGFYKVWRREEGETNFTHVLSGIAAVPAGKEFYVKQGLYRGGNVNGRTDVLWIGPTARGESFAAVEQQAFGTKDGVIGR